MNKEKLYDKFKKEFDVNDKLKGRRGKMRFADIIANKTFDKTYDSYVRNRQMSKSELQDLVLAEIRTEFTGVFAIIQWLLWMHRILVFIQFVLQELDE